MPEPIIAAVGLSKQFGAVSAVDDFSFSVERGQVCGLLGPNGAGKTTTLRMLMGLERPSRGSAQLFGRTVTPGCRELARVGAMVEQAAFVPHLSGLANLRLWWGAAGTRLASADLDGALHVADLGDAIHRKVRTYSQGMKQRLGFARLLLGRPELLVIDEPTNGLDPGEIREIRELIARLTQHQGATVLLSSHHLSEVEQTCSQVLVMNHGRLVASGTVSELIGSSGSVYVEVDDRDRARAVLASRAGRGWRAGAGRRARRRPAPGPALRPRGRDHGGRAPARDDHADPAARGRVPRPARRSPRRPRPEDAS